MTRAQGQGSDRVYDAAARVVDEGLRRDGSCFTPGQSVWTRENFDELIAHFVEQPDQTSAVSFEDKLSRQLGGTSPAAIQLMAELLFFHLLITMIVGGQRKRQLIELVLSWMPEPACIPEELASALDRGFVNPGTWYNTRRDVLLPWLIDFGRQWKRLPSKQQAALLTDPWGSAGPVVSSASHATP